MAENPGWRQYTVGVDELSTTDEKPASPLARLFLQEDLNFLVTNRIPRQFVTHLVGRYSRIKSRRLTRFGLAVWRLFADDLRLDEARATEFLTLHECFIRELRPGARPIDPDPDTATSPCDAIVGAFGRVRGATAWQAKGFPYSLRDLLPDPELARRYEDGTFVTLRLKSNMYHRFHAPARCRVTGVTYISGDTWNVNPIALRRVEALFCKNERAVVDLELSGGRRGLTLVPVAAIAVASIKLHCLPTTLDLSYRGPNSLSCDASYEKGEELGWFHAGSTILVFADREFKLAPDLAEGSLVRVGEPLFLAPPGVLR